ncbi:MAG: hypothetical protein CM15mP84_02840 [Cellvibrionales bacterium]|nr:MAG: hypothetical protein CM15mP84_02840 [Cellvibrionales bacterium]
MGIAFRPESIIIAKLISHQLSMSPKMSPKSTLSNRVAGVMGTGARGQIRLSVFPFKLDQPV